MERPWDDGSNTTDEYEKIADAAFELFQKLGVEYYTFHDADMAPYDATLSGYEKNVDHMAGYLKSKQDASNTKLLWSTTNLFSDPRYMNGAMTSPDFHAYARAGASVSKMLEVNTKLGGENFVFWGGREGYQSSINTNVKRELDHAAAFMKMVVDKRDRLGGKFQLLVEPKPKEPMKHQYDYDAATTMGFLNQYGLQNHYKLNIEPNHTTLAGHQFDHDIMLAAQYGMLGSVDANTGDELLGWDTDEFPQDSKWTTMSMLHILGQGGLGSGGLNFDCKVRRESVDLEDIFIAHIGAMDAWALGLKNAARMREQGITINDVKKRYSSWDEGLGAKIEASGGDGVTLEDLRQYVQDNGEPKVVSGKQEMYERNLAQVVYG